MPSPLNTTILDLSYWMDEIVFDQYPQFSYILSACPVSIAISVNLNYGFKLVKTLLGLKKMSTKGG
jgi:hypothetical protein